MRWGGNRRGTPKVIQALPMPSSVREATNRSSCLPSLMVAGFILALTFLEAAVPALVAVIR